MGTRYTLDKSDWPLIINAGGAVTKIYGLPQGSSGTDTAALTILARAYRDLNRLNGRKKKPRGQMGKKGRIRTHGRLYTSPVFKTEDVLPGKP